MDYYICVCYHQNLTLHDDGVNNFPLFDDDKPNDDIDIKDKSKLMPSIQDKKRHFRKSTQSRLNLNNHGHAHLPPFCIIEKR